MQKFWMVVNSSSWGTPAVRHETLKKAETEAARLANLHVGKDFFILEAIGGRKAQRPVVVMPLEMIELKIDEQEEKGPAGSVNSHSCCFHQHKSMGQQF